MPLSGGSFLISTSVKAVGKLGTHGTATSDSTLDVTRTVSSGSSGSSSFGTGTGSVNIVSSGTFTIAASSILTLDLYTGGTASTDPADLFSAAAPYRRIMGVCVEIVDEGSDSTSGVRIGGASANEWVGFFETAGDSLDIFPDGPPFAVGSPVGKIVGSTTKNLAVENLSTTAPRIVRVSVGGSKYAVGEWTGFWGFLTYP